jgi:hypothetical protein
MRVGVGCSPGFGRFEVLDERYGIETCVSAVTDTSWVNSGVFSEKRGRRKTLGVGNALGGGRTMVFHCHGCRLGSEATDLTKRPRLSGLK